MREIRLTQGHVALVDDADYETLLGYRWRIQRAGKRGQILYAVTGNRASTTYMHTLLTGWRMTDHADGNGLNNQRGNLRAATPTLNQANRPKLAGRTSRFKGVSASHTRAGTLRWKAGIKRGSRSLHLGYFDTEEAAARAYDRAACAEFGEFARPNFPQTPPAGVAASPPAGANPLAVPIGR